MPSFRQVLDAAARAYRDRPEDVRKGARELLDVLARAGAQDSEDGTDAELPGVELLDQAVRVLARQYDATHGGFGSAPKFPQPVTLEVLLREHVRTGDAEALDMAVHTLRRMAAGGMRDHLGGGFHRYSVDARWLVPHFEKMLYDNALLARAYLDAYRVSGANDLLAVAEDTLDYLLADMRSPEGGFYAAWDADSEGEEGLFYLWTPREVEAALPGDEARLFMRCYDVTPGGNFEGRSILWLPHALDAVARREGLSIEVLEARLASARAALLEVRARREPPFRDEKVLAGWNGMALRALAEAGGVTGRRAYLDAAVQGADFILAELRKEGRLLHTWRDGEARVDGFLEDYASLGNALLSLHEATLEPRWRDEARWCCQEVLHRFWNDGDGLFFDVADEADTLFMRARDPMDNATPSGTSLAAELLLRATPLFDVPEYGEVARRTAAREAAAMRRFPTAFGRMLSVVDRAHAAPVEVAVVGPREGADTRALVHATLAGFHRNLTVTGRAPDESDGGLPLLESREQVDGKPTAYVCRGYACRAPVTEPSALTGQLRELDVFR